MTPQEHKKEIQNHRKALEDLLENCPHQFKPLTQKDLDDEWMSVGAWCKICEKDFGWRCKESPDGVCHYYSDNGKVELINNTEVDVPEGHHEKAYNESDDWCIFCGHPEERK